MTNAIPIELLACPRSGQSLRASSDGYISRAADTVFPVVDGVPWLFAEPAYAVGEWRARFRHEIARLRDDSQRLQQALDAAPQLAATEARLKRLLKAKTEQQSMLTSLLSPLVNLNISNGSRATYLALRTRLPARQDLNTYYPNIHRDWVWGDCENRESLEAINVALAEVAKQPKRILVLGAGAGRLSSDLANSWPTTDVVSLDFNPLFMLLGRQLTRGDSVDLYEFPFAPKEADDVAHRRTLCSPHGLQSNCHWVLGDVMRAPFAAEAFDVVVTPWLIDIMDTDLADVVPRINQLLEPDGTWLNFGSLSFQRADPIECVGRDELIELVTQWGFQHRYTHEQALPYLDSPASRHARREEVITLGFTKAGAVPAPKQYRALPDWIVTGKTPVPANPQIQQQAAATRIHAFIMSMIDGQRSLNDMAQLMEQQKLMSRDDALDAIRGMLIKMYDEAEQDHMR